MVGIKINITSQLSSYHTNVAMVSTVKIYTDWCK